MDIDQNFRDLTDQRYRHRFPVYLADTATVHQTPADDDLVVLQRKIQLFQCFSLLLIVYGKDKLRQGKSGIFSGKAFKARQSKCYIDGTDDDGFSRTGLSGKDIKALGQINISLINEGHIFYMNV